MKKLTLVQNWWIATYIVVSGVNYYYHITYGLGNPEIRRGLLPFLSLCWLSTTFFAIIALVGYIGYVIVSKFNKFLRAVEKFDDDKLNVNSTEE